MSNGTTAIQVSPVDLDAFIEMFGNVTKVLEGFKEQQREITSLREALRNSERDLNHLSETAQDRAQQISLLRTEVNDLKDTNWAQSQEILGLKQELADERTYVEDRDRRIRSLENDLQAAQAKLHDVQRERDDYGMKHLEVSEALAQANAKLDKFREVLGIDAGPVTAGQVPQPPAPEVLDGSGSVESPKPSIDYATWEPYPVIDERAADTPPAPEVAKLDPTENTSSQGVGPTEEAPRPLPDLSSPSTSTPGGDDKPATPQDDGPRPFTPEYYR